MTDEKLKITQYSSWILRQANQLEQLFLVVLAGVVYSFFIQSFSLAIQLTAMFAGILYISSHTNFALKLRRNKSSKHTQNSVSAPTPPKNDPEENLDEFKQQMIQMLIHDLKTPLSNIISLSEQGKPGSNLGRIHQSGTQMLDMIMNILEVEKIAEAKLPVNATSQLSSHLIDNATSQVTGWAATKGITIQQTSHQVQVAADSRLATRVLTNLLSNAIKHAPKNSKILVSTKQLNANTVRFFVKDEGCGIAKNAQQHIFNKFYQVQSNTGDHAYSTGIGLNFCKLAIEAHGGTIGVDSQVGKGATFWFTLPISKKAQANANTSALRQKYDAYAPCDGYLSLQDKNKLSPWLVKLRQYEVYQLSKIKAVLNSMKFEKGSSYTHWKKQLEEALYSSNQEKYEWLIK